MNTIKAPIGWATLLCIVVMTLGTIALGGTAYEVTTRSEAGDTSLGYSMTTLLFSGIGFLLIGSFITALVSAIEANTWHTAQLHALAKDLEPAQMHLMAQDLYPKIKAHLARSHPQTKAKNFSEDESLS